jgi:RNA polymerase sigma factor (sigma-70 family)
MFDFLKKENCSDEQALKWLAETQHENRAIRCLIHRFFPKIKKYIRQNKGTPDDAREMLLIALTILMEKVRTGTYKPGAPLEAFVRTVVRNKWVDELRRRGHKLNSDDLERLPDPEDWDPLEPKETENERQREAAHWFQKLGEECKAILHKYYIEKKSMKQIAAEMNYANEKVVKAQKYRCLKNLHKMMGIKK